MADSIQTLVRGVPLFSSLSDDHTEMLVAAVREEDAVKGALLFREGDYGDRFYIVASGGIAIVKAMGSEDERLLGVRRAGEFIGEMSLLNSDGLRTASAVVAEDARLLVLTRADFDTVLHRDPSLAYEMLRVLSGRLREAHDVVIRDLHEKNRQLYKAYTDLQAAQAQLVEQEALARELRLAADIQMSMLPQTLPRVPGFAFGARITPARHVGGDFYDVFPLGVGRLGIAIGDVSGKGVPAALFMALASSLLRVEAERAATPQAVLAQLNHHLVRRNPRGMFVTAIYAVLEADRSRLTYVRAGHPDPVIVSAGGRARDVVEAQALPLGMFAAAQLDVQTVDLQPGDTVVLYTDGVSEAMDASEELFGDERITEFVASNALLPAQAMCDRLADAVARHRGKAPQSDDITLLAVRALGGPMTASTEPPQ